MRKNIVVLLMLFIMLFGVGTALAYDFQDGTFGVKYNGVLFMDLNYLNIFNGTSGLPLHPGQSPSNLSGNVWGIFSMQGTHKLIDNNPENNQLSGVAYYMPGSDGKYYFCLFGGLTYLDDVGNVNLGILRLKAAEGGAYLKCYEVAAADAGVYDAAVASGPNVPGKGVFDTFGSEIINAPSATLWLDAEFSQGTMLYYDGLFQPGEIELVQFNSSVTGLTEAYLDVKGGTASSHIKKGVFPLVSPLLPNRADLKIISDITADFRNAAWIGKWTHSAQDPITGEFFTPTCCIDLEKEVSVEELEPDWRDADSCDAADVPIAFAPHNAMYRLIVTNCGDAALTNVKITDTVLGIDKETVIDELELNEQVILTGEDISQLSYNENQCTSAGSILNTAVVEAICSNPAQSPVSDEDSACWKCEEKEAGGCRMTGGNNTVSPEGYVVFEVGPYANVTNKVQIRKNTTTTFKYTLGGQVGAPNAGCVAGPDKQFGEWTHSHHENDVLKFTFHGGTHSSPDDAYIHCIACSDPYWCVQARCAPFKQLFWEGTGVFKNAKNNDAPIKLSGCTIDPYSQPQDGYSLHYYKAHVADVGGEPGNTCSNPPCDKQPTYDPAICTWHSGGVDVEDTVLVKPQPPGPNPKWPQLWEKKKGMLCENCPDWYEIQIYCKATDPDTDPTNTLIYKAAGWFTGGNIQLHPEVSDQCPF